MSPRDDLLQYRAGWMDGAAGRFINKARAEHADPDFAGIYQQGYAAGQLAKNKALIKAADQINYTPAIVKAI